MTTLPVNPYCHCNSLTLSGKICGKQCLAVYGGRCPRHRNSKFTLCIGCGINGTQSQYGLCSANQSCRYKCMWLSRKNDLNKKCAVSIPLVQDELEPIIIIESPTKAE